MTQYSFNDAGIAFYGTELKYQQLGFPRDVSKQIRKVFIHQASSLNDDRAGRSQPLQDSKCPLGHVLKSWYLFIFSFSALFRPKSLETAILIILALFSVLCHTTIVGFIAPPSICVERKPRCRLLNFCQYFLIIYIHISKGRNSLKNCSIDQIFFLKVQDIAIKFYFLECYHFRKIMKRKCQKTEFRGGHLGFLAAILDWQWGIACILFMIMIICTNFGNSTIYI